MDLQEEDIISYHKVIEEQRKDKSEKRKKRGKLIDGYWIGLICVVYLFLYAMVFFFSQYGITKYWETNSFGNPTFLIIMLWVTYGFIAHSLMEGAGKLW